MAFRSSCASSLVRCRSCRPPTAITVTVHFIKRECLGALSPQIGLRRYIRLQSFTSKWVQASPSVFRRGVPTTISTGVSQSQRNEINGLRGHHDADGGHFSISIHIRRPSINSFAFDSPPRAIYARYCKGGIELKHTRRRLTRLSVTSEMGEGGRETAVSCPIGGILTKGFLPCDDGLVKATKLNKGQPHASKRQV